MFTNVIKQNRIIPVIVIDQVEHASPLAKTLLEAGITVLEITLRTPCALSAIECIRKKLPSIILGAGTIVTPQQISQAKTAGAHFVVSPALSQELIFTALNEKIPYLPGIATVTEALAAFEQGLTYLKFYPANIMGGAKALTSISEVLPQLKFCPTGGINAENFMDYLKISCVFAVGGSWIAPRNLIKEGRFKDIALLAEQAQNLLSGL